MHGQPDLMHSTTGRDFHHIFQGQSMSSQFAESLHQQYVGQTIGWVQITALKETDKGAISKVIARCRCQCNAEFERKLFRLLVAQKNSGTPSCGCHRKMVATAAREKQAQNALEKCLQQNHLSQAEQQQVQRILDSRRHKVTAIDRREAIDCVIRDRTIGDLVCHGGEAEIL
jgi:hypothetical protein